MKKRKARAPAAVLVPARRPVGGPDFDEVIALIEAARQRATLAVNTELVALYWKVGQHISKKIEAAEWGDGVVPELAAAIARRHPRLRGFTSRNLFRMRQFYEAYRNNRVVTPLVTQLPWTHHLIVLSQTKHPEEREFYLRMAIRERWGKRELERRIHARLFEQAVLRPAKVSPPLTQLHPGAADIFRDAYFLEFLGLPDDHSEADLHRGLLKDLQRFILEMGRDFCFVGSQYPLQVGGRDFALDLLFFHRGLGALVAIELKAGRFEPEHLGKLQFYLEALDRDVKKPHERPSIGMLLCANKDNQVVEYALARSTSPALIAEYQTLLPAKELLARELHQAYQALTQVDADAPEPKPGKAAQKKIPSKNTRKGKRAS